jgi:molybdopterin molybdotransferase
MNSALPSPASLSYAQAAALVAACAAQLRRLRPAAERVELSQASGRVLALLLSADRDQPPFNRSTRDGYACRAAEAATHTPLSVAGAARAGDPPSGLLLPGTVWEIMNGAPIPTGADAVVIFDHVEKLDGANAGKIRLLSSRKLKPGENIVLQGAQASAAEELLPAGSALHACQIALAAACGYTALEVFHRPRVAILTTGDELVPVDSLPAPGQIRNSNAPMLAALVAASGGEAWLLPTAADNAQVLNLALEPVLTTAAAVDMLVLSGGVSEGKFDLVEAALARKGARFHFTGVQIQPGKPTVFGELQRGKDSHTLPVLALPGNPVASTVAFLLFAAPLLAALAGNREAQPRFALARLAARVDQRGKPGLTRFLPAFCNFNTLAEQPPQVALVPTHGSGDLVALARSNCFLVVPEDAHSLKAGSPATILFC